jgi:hypothetical protein
MAKNRNKKNRAKSGGLAAMDISEGGPATSTAADVPQRTSPLSFSFIFVRVFFFVFAAFWLLRWLGSGFFVLCLAAMDTSEGKQPSSATAALGSINK